MKYLPNRATGRIHTKQRMHRPWGSLLVVVTEVENRFVINQGHAKLLEPALPAQNIAVNLKFGWEEYN